MQLPSDDQVRAFHRDGYAVFPGLFTQAELDRMQGACCAALGRDTGFIDLFAVPEVAHLWTDRRLVEIARGLLGEPLVYFFESAFNRYAWQPGEVIRGRHLHHDAKGTPENLFNRLHPAMSAVYPVVRLGIYFQDTAAQSGGLKVSPGSHLIDTSGFDQRTLPYVNIASKPGDLVCFCVRTLHSPFALRPAGDPDAALAPWVEDLAFQKMPAKFLPSPPIRETIFVDYAKADPLADLLIKSRAMFPDNRKSGLAASIRANNCIAAAQNVGLALRTDYAMIELASTEDDPAPPPEISSLARSWSPYFDILAGDAAPAAVRARIAEIRATMSACRIDHHMARYKPAADSL